MGDMDGAPIITRSDKYPGLVVVNGSMQLNTFT